MDHAARNRETFPETHALTVELTGSTEANPKTLSGHFKMPPSPLNADPNKALQVATIMESVLGWMIQTEGSPRPEGSHGRNKRKDPQPVYECPLPGRRSPTSITALLQDTRTRNLKTKLPTFQLFLRLPLPQTGTSWPALQADRPRRFPLQDLPHEGASPFPDAGAIPSESIS